LLISEKNECEIQVGMSFNVIVAATDLMCKEKKYAIMIADTIIIREDEPEILTGQASSKYDEISYSLQV